MPELPVRPSHEYLRKEAKRLARDRALGLAEAQRRVAAGYGFSNWAKLIAHVAGANEEPSPSAELFAAVRAGDAVAVRRLLDAGANPRHSNGRETPLHLAARRGPLAIVEMLIAGGALDWQPDAAGRSALEAARRGRARERTAIITLLDRAAHAGGAHRAAIAAIHAGDVDALQRVLDAQPGLTHEPIVAPQAYRDAPRRAYFLEPKLLWFVANNPRLVERLPPNIGEIAALLIARGADRADLDYALELTLTSAAAREDGRQAELVRLLLAAGAVPTAHALELAAGYRELDALRTVAAAGVPLPVPVAGVLGELPEFDAALGRASAAEIQAAFGLAVLNDRASIVRAALAAGADVNAPMPVHVHSTALHQAVLFEDVALIELLLAHGASIDRRDTLWDGTPLDWAIHERKPAARAVLERTASKREPA